MKIKGFTLIELLSVIVILSLILAIAVPSIANLIDSARNSIYVSNEKMLLKAAKTYAEVATSKLPISAGDISVIDLNELQENKYIDEIKDPKDGVLCTGKVVIGKSINNEYNYRPYLKCGSNYETYQSYLTDGLVLYLDGYDAPVSGYWEDKSGNNNNAQMISFTTTGYDSNKKGYDFDGISYMTINNPIPTQTPATQDWAVEAIVKVNSLPASVQKSLITGWNLGLSLSFANTNRLLLYLNNGTYDYYDYGYYNISNDKVEHVLFNFQYSTDLIEIYVNGVDVSVNGPRQSARIPSGITSLRIGSLLKGTIYELKIYNRHLTNSEVQNNYVIAKQHFGF